MLLFMDGQAHYDSSQLAWKYSNVDTVTAVWSIAAEGRFGNCVKRVATNNQSANYGASHLAIAPLFDRLGPWTPKSGGVCGFAIKVDDFTKINSALSTVATLFMVLEGNTHHLRVNLNEDGTFSLVRFRSGTHEGINGANVVAVSGEALQENAWAYVEFKWVIHVSAGSFAIRVNSVPVLSYTGRTQHEDIPASIGVWNTVRLLGVCSDPGAQPLLTMRMCDLYLADLTAPDPDDVDDFLGDGTIATIFPNGVGAASGWAPVPAAPNWDNVNDKPAPDGDTTLVRATAVGSKDVYHFEDLPAGAQVLGAHLNILARKEDEGTVLVRPIAHQNGVDYPGPEQGVASTVYDRYLTQPYDLNPATGAPWTWEEINNGQFGLVKTT